MVQRSDSRLAIQGSLGVKVAFGLRPGLQRRRENGHSVCEDGGAGASRSTRHCAPDQGSIDRPLVLEAVWHWSPQCHECWQRVDSVVTSSERGEREAGVRVPVYPCRKWKLRVGN